jgi:uncharacterized protein (TIGR02996 family)
MVELFMPSPLAGQLLAAIYAAPDDDGARLVYQDYLLENEDPRGEWMVLQFKRATQPLETHEAEREHRLFIKYGDEWLGELAPVVSRRDRVFKKGFLSGCTVDFRSAEEKKQLIDHPAWRTLERLGGDLDLICRPQLWILSSVGPLTIAPIEELAIRKLPAKVDELRIAVGTRWTENQQARLGKIVGLEQIRSLAVEFVEEPNTPRDLTPSVFRGLLGSSLIRHIESLSLRRRAATAYDPEDPPDVSPDLRQWLARLRTLPAMRSLTLFPSFGFAFRIDRSGPNFLLTVDLYSEFAAGHHSDFRRALTGDRARDFASIRVRQWGTRLSHHEKVFEAFESSIANLKCEFAGAL